MKVMLNRLFKELERCCRQPGETIAHYLSEMKRLKAQYSRVDPESRARGQRLLQRASVTRREGHDVHYAAGACCEKAVRVRCNRIHEDEIRGEEEQFQVWRRRKGT